MVKTSVKAILVAIKYTDFIANIIQKNVMTCTSSSERNDVCTQW